ncbi:hypothetical protein BsWGS_25310 [Bradybaena similaris]
MPLIEGIGDEVTLIIGGFLVCIILMFAWFSTHTADIPLLREVGVIVVELSQRRSRTQNNGVEERSGADLNGSSIEHEHSSGHEGTQRHETDNSLSEASSSQTRPGSASESYVTPSALPADQSADVPTPPHLVSGHAEGSSDTSTLEESETPVPKASVVVDDSKGFAYSTEEDIRQRRVNYFKINKPENSVSEEAAAQPKLDGNKLSSLSESSLFGSDSARHLNEGADVNCASNSDQTRTVGTTQEPVTSTSAADLENIASSLLRENINDAEDSSLRGGSSNPPKIRVKLKYMNETQRLVYAEPLDTIGDFRRTHFQAELQDNKWVRFIYNGQDLRDDARTLQACNIWDNCTVHCLITAQTQTHLQRDAVAAEEEDSIMGSMMYPLFTIIIIIVWYFRFTYRQYFSAMSTVCLIGISFLLALSYISSLRTADRTPPQHRISPPPPAAAGGGRNGLEEEHQHAE